MGSVWLALRAGLRSRWRPLLGLALLLGLIGGVVLTSAAGARRTDTAYPRLLQWSNAASVLVIPHGTGLSGYYGALARRRDVASMWTSVLYNMGLPRGNGVADTLLEAVASPDGALGVSGRPGQGRAGAPVRPRRPRRCHGRSAARRPGASAAGQHAAPAGYPEQGRQPGSGACRAAGVPGIGGGCLRQSDRAQHQHKRRADGLAEPGVLPGRGGQAFPDRRRCRGAPCARCQPGSLRPCRQRPGGTLSRHRPHDRYRRSGR